MGCALPGNTKARQPVEWKERWNEGHIMQLWVHQAERQAEGQSRETCFQQDRRNTLRESTVYCMVNDGNYESLYCGPAADVISRTPTHTRYKRRAGVRPPCAFGGQPHPALCASIQALTCRNYIAIRYSRSVVQKRLTPRLIRSGRPETTSKREPPGAGHAPTLTWLLPTPGAAICCEEIRFSGRLRPGSRASDNRSC